MAWHRLHGPFLDLFFPSFILFPFFSRMVNGLMVHGLQVYQPLRALYSTGHILTHTFTLMVEAAMQEKATGLFFIRAQIRLDLQRDAALQEVQQTTPPPTENMQQKLGFIKQSCGGETVPDSCRNTGNAEQSDWMLVLDTQSWRNKGEGWFP